MRLEQFEYLIEISHCKSMSIASRNLFMTPQALSMAIKSLEDELNVSLLERSTQGVVLTKQGEYVCHIAKQILKNIELLKEINKDKPDLEDQVLEGHLVIYTTPAMSFIFLKNKITDFLKIHTNVTIDVIELPPHTILNSIMSHDNENNISLINISSKRLDSIKKEYSDALDFIILTKSNLSILVSNQSKLANMKSVSVKTILSESVTVFSKFDFLRFGLSDYIDKFGEPKKVITCSNINITLENIAKNTCIGFGDKHYWRMLNNHPSKKDLIIIPLRNRIEMLLVATVKKNKQNLPIIKNFLMNFH